MYARAAGAVPSGRSDEAAIALVLEGVHLLADDVGRPRRRCARTARCPRPSACGPRRSRSAAKISRAIRSSVLPALDLPGEQVVHPLHAAESSELTIGHSPNRLLGPSGTARPPGYQRAAAPTRPCPSRRAGSPSSPSRTCPALRPFSTGIGRSYRCARAGLPGVGDDRRRRWRECARRRSRPPRPPRTRPSIRVQLRHQPLVDREQRVGGAHRRLVHRPELARQVRVSGDLPASGVWMRW